VDANFHGFEEILYVNLWIGNGRALLQIEKKGRASLGQGRALHPAKTG
jgi:hypothetical protein